MIHVEPTSTRQEALVEVGRLIRAHRADPDATAGIEFAQLGDHFEVRHATAGTGEPVPEEELPLVLRYLEHIRDLGFHSPYVEPLVRRTAEADLAAQPRPRPTPEDVQRTAADVAAERETNPDPVLSDTELLTHLGHRLDSFGVWPADWPVQPAPGDPPLTLLRNKRLTRLAEGTFVLRFGEEPGNLVHHQAVRFATTSLPLERERMTRTFRRRRSLHVITGVTVPWANLPGGAVAYVLPKPIAEHESDGSLERIE
ncbi:TNT domain-containing protein [Amycolatopsis sp. GA6-003]|uniref:TNT domain-containing protein n=1 Tax=Amycolatopsis sp. GA6-003 TaxID=2652444 RepID=UPI003916FFFA